MTILTQDDFTGTTIDTGKWTVTNPLGRIAQNGDLRITAPHTATESSGIISIASMASGVAAVQSGLDWTDPGTQEAVHGVQMWFSATYYAQIISRGTGGGIYRLSVEQNGVTVYNNSATGVAKGKDVKITYNFVAKQIKFWYWNTSTGAWVQMGTTQVYDLGATARGRIYCEDFVGAVNADVSIFDNFFFSDADYPTQTPLTAPVTRDFRTYTEVDPGSKIAVYGDGTGIAVNALPRDPSSYVVFDWGVGALSGKITTKYKLNVASATAAGVLEVATISDTLGEWTVTGNSFGEQLYSNTGANFDVYLIEVNAGVSYNASPFTLAFNTDYYVKRVYDASVGTYGTLTLTYYSDVAQTVPVATRTLALHTAIRTYEFDYGLQTAYASSLYTITAEISFMEVTVEGATKIPVLLNQYRQRRN